MALKSGYQVSYIAFELTNWTKEKETSIQLDLGGVGKIYIPAGRQKLVNWAIGASCEFVLRKISGFLVHTSLISFAISRRSLQLFWILKKIKYKPDLVIAHNPGAFYPALHFAKSKNIPFAIDIEDYHPGEGDNTVLKDLNLQLLKKIAPFAQYVSFAAPLIQEKIAADVLPEKISKAVIVENVFSSSEFIMPKNTQSTKIQLVWFSQNIDFGRGLEKILPVLETLKEYYQLTLIGNVREAFYESHLKDKNFITIIPPLEQNKLNNKLAEFDIGLAIEVVVDENRDICLTNKIWSYFQAGLFIVASDTKAQQEFIKKFSEHGIMIYLDDKEKLQGALIDIYHGWNKILEQKYSRYLSAKTYNWESESKKLELEWKRVLAF